jgi:UDP-glucose 4-epimerase
MLVRGDLSPSSTPIPPMANHDGNFKAYNLGRGQAFSVLQIVEAMSKATGCKYEYEIVGRRYVHSSLLFSVLCPQELSSAWFS